MYLAFRGVNVHLGIEPTRFWVGFEIERTNGFLTSPDDGHVVRHVIPTYHLTVGLLWVQLTIMWSGQQVLFRPRRR